MSVFFLIRVLIIVRNFIKFGLPDLVDVDLLDLDVIRVIQAGVSE